MNWNSRAATAWASARSPGPPQIVITRAAAGPNFISPAASDSQRWTRAAATGSSGSQLLVPA